MGPYDEDAVGADPPVSVATPDRKLRLDGLGNSLRRPLVDEDEVVAETVQLEEVYGSMRDTYSRRPSIRRQASLVLSRLGTSAKRTNRSPAVVAWERAFPGTVLIWASVRRRCENCIES